MNWTLTKKLDTFVGPGEIKRREVSWTLLKKLDTFAGPGEIKRREVVLDPQVSPEEIKNREVELSLKAGFVLHLFSSHRDPGPSKILRPRSIPAWTQLTWE